MQNSISHLNPDDLEKPPIEHRIWEQIDKLSNNQSQKEMVFYRIISAFRDEIAQREEEWKQLYFINT